MRDAIEAFELRQFQEHIDEASFLYEQRLAQMFRTAVTWTELASLEERRKAHLDTLESGGMRALDLAATQARTSGAEGDIFVAVSLVARLNLFQPLAGLISALPKKALGGRALTDALNEAAPDAWAPQLRALADTTPGLAPAVIYWHGTHGIGSAGNWLAGKEFLADAALALCQCYARLGEARGCDWLAQLLATAADEELLLWSALALAMLDRQRTLALLRPQAIQSWSWLPLALIGTESDGVHLLRHLRSLQAAPPEGLLALGLHGYPEAVPWLLDCLSIPELAEPAAEALNTLLGAECYEERFQDEDIDPDELNDEERAQFARGERPPNPNGQRAGDWKVCLSRDPLLWRNWWQGRAGSFSAGRYRHGEVCTPAVLLEGIRSMGTSNLLRRWNAVELATRHGLPWQLNIYASVATQRRQIQAMAQQIAR
jgi:hypothetical protein